MRRRIFDIVTSAVGAMVVVVLVVSGALLMWGYSFTSSNVHHQLAEQQIFFPGKGSPQLDNPKIGPYLSKYAGQQLLTGPQAKAYADRFIAVHLSELPDNGVYAKLSAAARAHPDNTQLADAAQTSFQGTTLRGLLLEAYAFSTIGQVAFWGGIAAFTMAFVLAILVAFGFWHARRVPEQAELFSQPRAEQPRAG